MLSLVRVGGGKLSVTEVMQLVNVIEAGGLDDPGERLQRQLDRLWQSIAADPVVVRVEAALPGDWKLYKEAPGRRNSNQAISHCKVRTGIPFRGRLIFPRWLYLKDQRGRIWRIRPHSIAGMAQA